MKYRKKPVAIEAEQWFYFTPVTTEILVHVERNPEMVAEGAACEKCGALLSNHGVVATLEGHHIVCPGDWIIRGVKGKFYPCKPDIFELTYDVCEEGE